MRTTMRRTGLLTVALGLFVLSASGQKTRELESNTQVSADGRVALKGFSGVQLDVHTWDKQEASVKLSVRFSSSSEKTETEYIENVRIEQHQTSDGVEFEFEQPSVTVGFSLKSLLSFRFNTYVRKEIRGEVFLPAGNSFATDVRYGKLTLAGVLGEVEVESKSSTIDVQDCPRIAFVENDYGTTTVNHSGGTARFTNKSGKLMIEDFSGSLEIDAPYGTVSVESATQSADVRSQSGTLTLRDIGKDVTIVAPYSDVRLEKAGGMVSIRNKSGSVNVQDVDGITVDAPYSTIDLRNVRGAGGRAVSVSSQSGRISVDDSKGPLSVKAPYTAINLRSITGSVELETKSGSVDAEDIRGNWTSRSEYSTITLKGLHAETVMIENKSGTVDVDLATATRSLEIFNSYSDVNIKVPKGLNAQVRLKAEYGSISSAFPVGSEKMGSGAISIGSVGTGAGVFTVENKSGSIRVTEKRDSQ